MHLRHQQIINSTMLRSINAARSLSSSATRNAFARMHLLGSIGSIFEKETRDGTPYLNYSLAVNRYSPLSAQDGKNTVTDWYNISVFDEKHVSFFQTHLNPGAQVYVEADVKQRTVLDESGENKQVFTTLRQTRFDVVRFPRKKEEELEPVE